MGMCVCVIVCVGEVIIHGFVKYSDSCVSMSKMKTCNIVQTECDKVMSKLLFCPDDLDIGRHLSNSRSFDL